MEKIIIFDNEGVIMKPNKNYSEEIIIKYNLNENQVNNFFSQVFLPLCLTGKADLKKELSNMLLVWNIKKSPEKVLENWFKFESNLDEKVLNLVSKLRDSEFKCYISTNSEKYRTNYLINELNYNNLFDGIFSSYNIGYKKPDHKFYEYILSNLNTNNPNNILYIDDNIKNIISAKELGINVIHYKSIEDLRKLNFYPKVKSIFEHKCN